MKKQEKDLKKKLVNLRSRAELDISNRGLRQSLADKYTDSQKLLHELEVHEVELQLQNEELRESQVELQKALQEYSDLYDSAPVGYASLNSKGTIVRANATLRSLLFLDRETLTEQSFTTLLSPDDTSSFNNFIRAVFSSTNKQIREVKLAERYGEARVVRLEGVATSDRAECRVVVIDVTEQRRARLVLQQALGVAEAATRAKSDFLSNMSHEIRTPMNGVLGMLQLTLNSQLSAEQRENLETASESAQALLVIINDILDIAKIEAGKFDLVKRKFDLSKMLGGLMETMGREALRKGVAFSLINEVGSKWVEGDESRIRQILINLISNAIKFTAPEGLVKLQLRSIPNGSAAEGHTAFIFSVSDTGIGLAENDIPKLFQRFSQIDSATTRRFGGTGLGLNISKQLAELMGGTITVTSTVGIGSDFKFRVALSDCYEQAAEQDSFASVPSHTHDRALGTKLNILVAEDDPINQKLLSKIFERRGHIVSIAGDGNEAVRIFGEQLKEAPFHAVVMDAHMPNADGCSAAQRIRSLERTAGRRTPIIGVSADVFAANRELCIRSGMDELFNKPFDAAALVTCVDRMVANRLNY